MALKITKVLVDDIDESLASATVSFSFRGVSYTIDLNDQHQAEFDAAVAPYIAKAARTGGRRTRSRGKRPAGPSRTAAIRAWASDEGMKVADRGRIPAEIIAAYDKAHA